MGWLNHETGTSLVELLLVLVIIGITTTMAVPNYLAMTSRVQLRTAAREIASELRMARQLAMARRERLLVRFSLIDQTVTLRGGEGKDVIDIYRYAEKGITLDEPTAGPDLMFHPSGRSASATTILLHDRQGETLRLTVSVTGRVVVS